METILQTGRLFLRNLAFSCTKDELQELFERFGTISQVSILSICLLPPSSLSAWEEVCRDEHLLGTSDSVRRMLIFLGNR